MPKQQCNPVFFISLHNFFLEQPELGILYCMAASEFQSKNLISAEFVL